MSFGGSTKQVRDSGWSKPPNYDDQYAALKGLTYESLFPRYQTMGKQMWQDELMPGVREAYEAKRNPYGGGLSDTPEFANLSKESRNLSSQAMQQAAGDYMGVQQLLTGMAGKPQYEEPIYQYEPNPWMELLKGGIGLGGSALSGYMGGKAMTDAMGGMLGKTAASNIYNSPYNDFFGSTKGKSPWEWR